MKKILIIGPISNFGGREIEANIIFKSLEFNYNVSILSTSYIDDKSFALLDVNFANWNSIDKILFQNNLLIRCCSYLSKILNNGDKKVYGYVNNSIINKILNIKRLQLKNLKKKIEKSECVIFVGQLSSNFLPEIVNFSNKTNIPCIVRPTGTIRKIEINKFEILKRVRLFVHHSEINANYLNTQLNLPYIIIDQCAASEDALMTISHNIEKPIRYGFIGRFSPEKGIIPLLDFFKNTSKILVLAGDGSQKAEILELIKDSKNITYIGSLASNDVSLFFNKIDILIIPSQEEAGPLVALEAMVSAKLIISTDVGAMKERLNDLKKTFWFDINNLNSLRLIIEDIDNCSEIELNLLKEEIRNRYLDKYTQNKIANQYIKMIESL